MERSGSLHANPRPLTQRSDAVFESHFRLFAVDDPAIVRLREYCLTQVLQFVARLNGYGGEELRRIRVHADAWFHITRRGGFFALHNHPNASWSGVYCVDPGRHDAGAADSGLLSFVNPAIASAMFMDAGTARLSGPYSYNVRHLRLEPGQLVIFPSWVLHDVKPFAGEGERITVAFNCSFVLPDRA